MSEFLVRYNAARTALAEALRVDEVKDIRDEAMKMRAYAEQAKDHELIQQATELRLRAERRLGEIMKCKQKRSVFTKADGHRKNRVPWRTRFPNRHSEKMASTKSWLILVAKPQQCRSLNSRRE